jgi:hypothetical protein
MVPRIFNEETKNIGARVEYRSCISAAIFALFRSSNALSAIVLGLLRAVPQVAKEFQDDWTTIETVNVDFPYKETKNGTMYGAQTFGPWEKKLHPDKLPVAEIFQDAFVDKDDIEMRIVFSGYCDDRWYLNGEMLDDYQYASNEYKEIEPWDENKTLTVDVENFYPPMGPDRLHPHEGYGTIEVQTRIKPGSCTYVNRVRIRDFRYGMNGGSITYTGLDTIRGTLKANCDQLEFAPCQNFPPETSRKVKAREVTFPPPKGNKTPPCRRFVNMTSFGSPPFPSIHKLSDGPLGKFEDQWRQKSQCTTEISFSWMPSVDVIPSELGLNTCSALFTASSFLEIFTYLDSPVGHPLGTWQYVELPGGNQSPKWDARINEPLRKYFRVDVNLSSRYYDRIDTKRNKCVCDDLETSRCLDPATKRAIEKALFDGACVLAGTMVAGAVIKLAATPQGAACLLVGGAIILSANAHNGDDGKPPRR